MLSQKFSVPKIKFRLTVAVGFIATLLPCSASLAQTPQQFGDFTVHYNAFTSDTLQPAMAKAYGVTRSKNRGLITISILKKSMSPVGTPVKARVLAKATNLTGQLKDITFREVDDSSSIYYLSEFRVAHQEVLDFTIDIRPKESSNSFSVKFRQKFYTQ